MVFRGWGKAFKTMEGWLAIPLGQSKYAIYYPESDQKRLTFTGGTDTIQCTIPFAFRVLKIALSFNDTTNRSVSIATVIARLAEMTYPIKTYNDDYDTSTNELISFKENEADWDENDKIQLSFVGTVNDYVYPVIYVQGLR